MRPVVVVFFVLDQDSTFFFVPKYIVVIALFTLVDADKAGVDVIFIQGLDHIAAVGVGANIGHEGAVQPQPGKGHGGVGGIANSFDNFGVVKWQLGAKLHGQPLTFFVFVGYRLVVNQFNKGVGYDI